MDSPPDRRWEQGIPHHPCSVRIIKAMQETDTALDVGIKTGGDGDFGETLMYLLDEFIDQHGVCPGCGGEPK